MIVLNNKLLSVVLLCVPDLITVTNFIIIFITLLINVRHKDDVWD